MSKNILSKIPYMDRKAEDFGVYVSKIEACTEVFCIGDALDPILIENYPTQSEFVAPNNTNPQDQELIQLCKENKIHCAIIMLGQGKSLGLAVLSKTKMMILPMN